MRAGSIISTGIPSSSRKGLGVLSAAACAHSREPGKQQRQHRVPSREGQTEKAPRRLVAGDDLVVLERSCETALAPFDGRAARTFRRPRPPFPLDAGMIKAERGIERGRRARSGAERCARANRPRRAPQKTRRCWPARRNNRRNARSGRDGTADSRRRSRKHAPSASSRARGEQQRADQHQPARELSVAYLRHVRTRILR